MSEDGTQVEGEVAPKTQEESKEQPKTVDYSTYERVKNDMHKFKREAQESKDKLGSLEERLNSMEQESLEKSSNWKELYERERQKREELAASEKKIKESVIYDKKFSAIEKEAIKAGIRDLGDIEGYQFDGVEIETTSTGKYNVYGASEWIDELKNAKPHWFKSNEAPNINNSRGSFDGKPKELNTREILDLQKKDEKAYREYMKSRVLKK